jgi:hypothetical protein
MLLFYTLDRVHIIFFLYKHDKETEIPMNFLLPMNGVNPFTGDFDLPKRIRLNGFFFCSFSIKENTFFIKIFNFGDVTKKVFFLHFLKLRKMLFCKFFLTNLINHQII